jgi:hypothetical protein
MDEQDEHLSSGMVLQ